MTQIVLSRQSEMIPRCCSSATCKESVAAPQPTGSQQDSLQPSFSASFSFFLTTVLCTWVQATVSLLAPQWVHKRVQPGWKRPRIQDSVIIIVFNDIHTVLSTLPLSRYFMIQSLLNRLYALDASLSATR